jgi:CHAD domain-containing protein
MAKAYKIPDLDCEADAAEGISKVLTARIKQVVDLIEPAFPAENNVKVIHDLRVSIRRLRSALRDFSVFLKKNSVKKIRKDLKKLARLLGSVRDVDVEIEILKKLKQEIEEEEIRISIDKLINEKSLYRSSFMAIASSELKDSVESLVQRIQNLSLPPSGISFKQLGEMVLKRNCSEFLALSSALFDPFDVESLHRLRIAGKRLRYSLELFSSCSVNLLEFAEEIAKMQRFLGDLHDCDVWLENLKNDLLENKIDKSVGVWLLCAFTKRRAKSYVKALQLWYEWEKRGFIEKLK